MLKKLKHNMIYWPLRVIWLALSLLPLWLHHAFAWILSIFLGDILRYRNKVITKNLTATFPEKTPQEISKIKHQFYLHFCDVFVETIKYATLSEKNIKKHVVFKGTDIVNEILREGQSVAMYLGHYGNWEWITSIKKWITPDICGGQIYHPLENAVFDRLFLNVRERMGSQCIPMTETVRWIINAQRQGKPSMIGYISDQVPTWNNIHHWLKFLNQTTPVFTGTERIARKFNHAVVYLDVIRVARGYYQCEFKLITRNPQELPQHQLTDTFFELLEQTIRRAPQYWLWSHNRWKRTYEEFSRRFSVDENGHVVERQPK